MRGAPQVHQPQSWQRCGLHAVNALLQLEFGPLFTVKDFEQIAEDLTPSKWWWSPHKSMFSLGNYDVNVLTMALEQRGLSLRWHNAHVDTRTVDVGAADFVGFVVNHSRRIMGVKYSNHWLAIRSVGGLLLNLDSLLRAPEPFLDPAAVHAFLAEHQAAGSILFVVTRAGPPTPTPPTPVSPELAAALAASASQAAVPGASPVVAESDDAEATVAGAAGAAGAAAPEAPAAGEVLEGPPAGAMGADTIGGVHFIW